MKFRALPLAALFITACATAPERKPCNDLTCLLADATRPVFKQCMSDLFFYPRKLRRAIDREYRYPLTNYDTYNSWTMMGNNGPSPDEWCRAYAKGKARVVMPATVNAFR